MAIFDKVTGEMLFKATLTQGAYRLPHIIQTPYTSIVPVASLTDMDLIKDAIRTQHNEKSQKRRATVEIAEMGKRGLMAQFYAMGGE